MLVGGAEVPRNARLLVMTRGRTAFELATFPEGEVIAATVEEGPLPGSAWIHPTEWLTPGQYALRYVAAPEAERSVFVVTDDTDPGAPPAPDLVPRPVPPSLCGGVQAAAFGVANPGAFGGATAITLLITATTAEGEHRFLSETPELESYLVGVTTGRSPCLGRGELVTTDEEVTVRAVGFDAAGNASLASAPLTLRLEPSRDAPGPQWPTFGCAAAAGAGWSALIAWVPLSLRAARRRSRR